MYFKKLNIDDLNEIATFTNQFAPYSDFNPTSLWIWNTNDRAEYRLQNNVLVIRIPDYLNPNENVISLLGRENVDRVLIEIIEEWPNLHASHLSMVPHTTIEAIDPQIRKELQIEEDQNNHDYIYELENLINPAGNKLKSVRRKLNKFSIHNSSICVRELDINDKANQETIINMFDEWVKVTEKDDDTVVNDKLSLKRTLEYSNMFDLITIGVFINERMIGFTISELLPNNYVIGHKGAYNYEYDGINQFLEQQTALHAVQRGKKYLNLEQDLGIESLRASKRLLRHVHYLKKYIIKF